MVTVIRNIYYRAASSIIRAFLFCGRNQHNVFAHLFIPGHVRISPMTIRTMFLMESSCIGFIGGVLGVLISLLVSFILNNLTTIMASFGQYVDLSGIMGGYGASSSTISIIPPWLMLGALVFATLIGLVSGILPANKAVKISALEAIRHD